MTTTRFEQVDPQPNQATFDEEFAAQLAESREAFERYSKTVTNIERQMAGRFFGMPSAMQSAYDRGEISVYRCGLRKHSFAQFLVQMLTQQGWRVAPNGTRMRGTEMFDADDAAVFVWAEVSVARRMREVQRRAQSLRTRQEASTMGGFVSDIQGLGVEVERFDVRAGQAGTPDVAANVRDSRDRSQAQRTRVR